MSDKIDPAGSEMPAASTFAIHDQAMGAKPDMEAVLRAEVAELEAALIEKLAPDDVNTDMPGGVMIRHRYSAKKWRLVRRELSANGVEYTLERRATT